MTPEPTTDTDTTDEPNTATFRGKHLVPAAAKVADMAVDIAAIAAVAVMAVHGVDPALVQPLGAMVVSVALGKRYMQRPGKQQA